MVNPEKGSLTHTSPRFGLTLQQNGINGDELVSERISYAMMAANGDPEEMDKILSIGIFCIENQIRLHNSLLELKGECL